MPAGEFTVATTRRHEMIDLTAKVELEVRATGVTAGICILYNPHTTAALTINEGADPDVRRDLLGALERILPCDYPYQHAEGNSPAHLMTMLTGSSVTVLIHQGRLRLGTWQRIFFCEYDGPRDRTVWWKILAG
ncbi:MAG: secondary thiamine-phosphate synthase enzyme YjbQ [Desulfobulbus sp.]|jgi:secondary thiamine-phosphate synthase enzyme|nr:secondary thiamine-phosphate synthase enzyme YjbQ [Desulfobulbus sp.]